MAKRFTLRSVIVCDDIRTESSGKDILIGVYNGAIVFPRLPAALRQLIVRLEYELIGAREHTFKLAVADDDGSSMFEAAGELTAPPSGEPVVLALAIGNAHFAKEMRLNIRFGIDSSPRQVFWLNVRAQGNATSQAGNATRVAV